MIIVGFKSGLGNQMFQYAFYYSLKNAKEEDVLADISLFKHRREHNGYELEKIFGIKCDVADEKHVKRMMDIRDHRNIFYRIFRKAFPKKTFYRQPSAVTYYPSVYEMSNKYLLGYWQSELYFDNIREEIKKVFTFPKITDDNNLNALNKIRNTNSVSIHVRRGDYEQSEVFKVCTLKYYKNAIGFIRKKVVSPLFFVFSDDIEWCKDNFDGDEFIFLNFNRGENSFRDMQLMSECKHHIIANSTFSWWGAWLGETVDSVIVAPAVWLNFDELDRVDIIPKRWIKAYV